MQTSSHLIIIRIKSHISKFYNVGSKPLICLEDGATKGFILITNKNGFIPRVEVKNKLIVKILHTKKFL